MWQNTFISPLIWVTTIRAIASSWKLSIIRYKQTVIFSGIYDCVLSQNCMGFGWWLVNKMVIISETFSDLLNSLLADLIYQLIVFQLFPRSVYWCFVPTPMPWCCPAYSHYLWLNTRYGCDDLKVRLNLLHRNQNYVCSYVPNQPMTYIMSKCAKSLESCPHIESEPKQ